MTGFWGVQGASPPCFSKVQDGGQAWPVCFLLPKQFFPGCPLSASAAPVSTGPQSHAGTLPDLCPPTHTPRECWGHAGRGRAGAWETEPVLTPFVGWGDLERSWPLVTDLSLSLASSCATVSWLNQVDLPGLKRLFQKEYRECKGGRLENEALPTLPRLGPCKPPCSLRGPDTFLQLLCFPLHKLCLSYGTLSVV